MLRSRIEICLKVKQCDVLKNKLNQNVGAKIKRIAQSRHIGLPPANEAKDVTECFIEAMYSPK